LLKNKEKKNSNIKKGMLIGNNWTLHVKPEEDPEIKRMRLRSLKKAAKWGPK